MACNATHLITTTHLKEHPHRLCPSNMSPELTLDPAIKLWALLPILAVMVMVGLGRHYATILVSPSPPTADSKELREQAYLSYSGLLRGNAFNIGPEEYARRTATLVPEFRRGEYLANPDAPPPSPMPNFLDPRSSETMISGVRQQVLNFVPQTLVMQWVTAFFGSFVVMKLPFPLTSKFKDMLQANLNTKDLDVRWVSSISLYILPFLGLSGVYSLILGENNQAAPSQPSAGVQNVALPANVDRRQLFHSEADLLELEKPKFILTGVCERVVEMPI